MRPEMYSKVSKYCLHLAFLISSVYLFLILFFVYYYIHEGGHCFFGILSNLINYGILADVQITNWLHHPLLQFINLPQQTRLVVGHNSLAFILGGTFFVLVTTLILVLLGYVISRKKSWFLLLIPVLLFEIFGNSFCGTDNITGNTLPICSQFHLNWITSVTPFLFALIAWFILINSNFYLTNFLRLYRWLTTKNNNPKGVSIKKIDINDPLKENKLKFIESTNRVGDLINSINRDAENQILVFVSIIASGLLSFLLAENMYSQAILLSLILLCLLLIFLVKQSIEKRKLRNQAKLLVEKAKKEVNLDLSQ